MMLYQSDMAFSKPYIHWNTKNTSFLRMAIVLKRMGIKNYTFFLTLHQKELENVDPHDPNLSDELKAKVLLESKLNPWYFFREVIRIPASGDEAIPFELHRGNLAAIWAFFNDIDFGLIQPRQTGKTYVTQSLVCYVMFVLADSLKIGMFTKDTVLVQDNVMRLKELRDNLPKYFVQKTAKDWDRKEGVSYDKKKNFYLTFTSANDERGAYKLGRGATMALLHFDEIAFSNYNWIVVPTAVNAMLKASEQARKAGLPSPVIYTTTAGNPDTREGSYALSIFESGTPFTEQMYDLPSRDALREVIRKSGSGNMLYLEFSYRQLGKSDQWFHDAAARSKSSQDDINRDLLNMWQSATDKAVIPQHLLTQIRESRMEPCYVDFADGFTVRWYMDRSIIETEEFRSRPMIMGMDTSENVGRDFTTFCIIDPRDMKVVATCRCNESNTMQVARHIVTLLVRYKNLTFIPERNNTGIGIIDFVLEALQSQNINPFTRIYNEVVQNYQDPKYKDVSIHNYRELFGKVRATFGFRTTGGTGGNSRNMLYKVTMMKTLEMNHSRIYDRSIISELCNLTERNGRIDHPVGCHDDTVISYLLACWLVYFGKNLHHYGIPEGTILQTITETGCVVAATAKQEQINIRRRIAELEEFLARNPAHIVRESYLRELSVLRPLVDDTLVAVKPLAVSQMQYQEREVSNRPRGATLSSLQSFSRRWNAA